MTLIKLHYIFISRVAASDYIVGSYVFYNCKIAEHPLLLRYIFFIIHGVLKILPYSLICIDFELSMEFPLEKKENLAHGEDTSVQFYL